MDFHGRSNLKCSLCKGLLLSVYGFILCYDSMTFLETFQLPPWHIREYIQAIFSVIKYSITKKRLFPQMHLAFRVFLVAHVDEFTVFISERLIWIEDIIHVVQI